MPKLQALRLLVLAAAAGACAAVAASTPVPLLGYLFGNEIAPGVAQALASPPGGRTEVVAGLDAASGQRPAVLSAANGLDAQADLRYAAADLAARGAAQVFVHTRGDSAALVARVAVSYPATRFVVHSARALQPPLPNVATYALRLEDAAFLGGMLAAASQRPCTLGLLGEGHPDAAPVWRQAFGRGAASVRAGALLHVEVVEDLGAPEAAQAVERLRRAGACVLFVRAPADHPALQQQLAGVALIAWREPGAPAAAAGNAIAEVAVDLRGFHARQLAAVAAPAAHSVLGASQGVFQVELGAGHFPPAAAALVHGWLQRQRGAGEQ
jgi:basic membrane lipoprotein Med (substrate-binding protein (PBP1-ABC) superfamily)